VQGTADCTDRRAAGRRGLRRLRAADRGRGWWLVGVGGAAARASNARITDPFVRPSPRPSPRGRGEGVAPGGEARGGLAAWCTNVWTPLHLAHSSATHRGAGDALVGAAHGRESGGCRGHAPHPDPLPAGGAREWRQEVRPWQERPMAASRAGGPRRLGRRTHQQGRAPCLSPVRRHPSWSGRCSCRSGPWPRKRWMPWKRLLTPTLSPRAGRGSGARR
jgi:hypothetical protein